MQAEISDSATKLPFQNDNIVVDYVLRYELYRHRDLSERLSTVLNVDNAPDAFNRSTWDILFFLIQSHLEGKSPSVTDIYLSTSISKGTAISGLAELERRGGVIKIGDPADKRRRLITISDMVVNVVHEFLIECQERLPQSKSGTEVGIQSGGSLTNDSGEPLIDLLQELSHEVRTPLTAIIGFSEMIADEALGPVQPIGYAEYARDIGKAASHLLTSLNERVDTALAEHGASISLGAMAQADSEELVDAACRMANEIAERRGITLRRRWGAKNSVVLADKDRLTQAVRKLIEGLASSTPRGQFIDVETLLITRDKRHFVNIRVLSTQLEIQQQPNDRVKDFHLRNDDILPRNLTLITAITDAHDGYIDKDLSNPNGQFYSICLPRVS